MAIIIVPGDINRTRFVPAGWEGRCPMCGAEVLTEWHDFNLGDGTEFLIACPTERCEGRIKVSAPDSHNGAHASNGAYSMLAEK